MKKGRIDNLLVARGLVEDINRARALIMAGHVKADGRAVTKAGSLVAEGADITIDEPPPFVSRGGIKLDHALDCFNLDVSSMVAVDVGASTGGFTDCLLKRGAARVYAIDVGYGQLDYSLRRDARVVVMDRVNARYSVNLPEKVDLVTIDVSFISVEKIIPSVIGLLKDGGQMVVLIKPQFEAKKEEVGQGGVIRKPLVQATVLGRFITWMTEKKLRLGGLVSSPIAGASGNREFCVLIRLV